MHIFVIKASIIIFLMLFPAAFRLLALSSSAHKK